ncbi:hypothetical protein BBJ28_00020832 [Nothophytophthora sp. Chile5]|nr:hypothetical protein BBJ28_00020832 [Nothophytophthora sp. Chile5]
MMARSDSMARKAGGSSYVQLPELYGHSRKVLALGFNCDGTLMASGSNDRTIRIWETASDREAADLRGHTDAILSLAWDPTAPHKLATTGADKTVRLWNAKTGRITHSMSLPNEASNIAYSHDAKYIVASNLDCITLIDTRKVRVVRRMVNPFEAHEVQFSKSGFLFVAAGSAVQYCRSSIRWVRFNHDGQYLAIGTEDTTLVVVDTKTYETKVTLQLQNNLQYLCWHPSKNLLAYVGDKPSSDKNSNRDGVIKMIELKE